MSSTILTPTHKPAATASFTPSANVQSRYAVPAMRCAGCIAKLESNLPKLPGIHSARVNFSSKQVVLEHDPALSEPQIVEAIEALGFDAHAVKSLTEADTHADSETRWLLICLGVAAFAMMNVMLLSISVWSGAEGGTRDMFHWLSAIIAVPCIAVAGQPFFKSAWNALKRGTTNMDVPISIGVVIATLLSLYETATHGPHAYFDGAVMLLFFLLCGRVLDAMMRGRARSGVAALLKQSATGALVRQSDGTTLWRPADELAPNMRLIVAAGERLAADGVIEAGNSTFDLSLLTGESAPQAAGVGDTVLAGTLNISAPVTIKVTAAAQDTTLADIARLMDDAGQGRSRYVRLADRAARWYAPAVHTLAALAFIGWMMAGADWHQSLIIAVAVLIITCPCALGLAVPASQVVAAGTLMRHGILVKDGSALERLAEADRALFDKTGTLTMGRAQLLDAGTIAERDRPILLALASASRHPLSNAIRQSLTAMGVKAAALDDVMEEPGFGVRATTGGRPVSLGRPEGDAGLATNYTGPDGDAQLLRFADGLRPDAAPALAALQAMDIPASIVSGDRAEAVAQLSAALCVPHLAEARPADKVAAIADASAGGHRVLMIGDGLNDGPALAAAHVSMAPSSASDVGQQAADAVFMGDSLMPVATAVRVARKTMQIVRQNLGFAIAYNVVAVPIALLGYVTPLIAAIAMSTSSLVVVGNALRLRYAAR